MVALGGIRPMHADDTARVLAIQSEAYGDAFVEAAGVIEARLAAAPDTAWVAETEAGVAAYLVGYRSLLGRVTPLGGPFRVVLAGDCLYLHDLAVARQAVGRGIGRALAEHALAWARRAGLGCSGLVSVQDSQAFWLGLGYRPFAGQVELSSYPGGAVYMSRSLP